MDSISNCFGASRARESNSVEAVQVRSADFQSAVLRIFNPHGVKSSSSASRLQTCETAECNSALPGAGFTVIELLAIIAVLAMAAMMLVPAAARTGPNVRGVQCLSNARRLMTAWQMYAHDNQDKLVAVIHGGSNMGGSGDPTYGKGWAEGWLDWTSSSDNTNASFLVNPRYADIAPYVNGAADLFKCPANKYVSALQKALGWSQRARSYSAQVGMGIGNAELGPWDAIYKHVTKTADLLIPSPRDTTFLVEEHPDSMNDPAWFPPQNRTLWVSVPGTYHNGGCTFGFADGHSELHPWRGSLMSARAQQVHAIDGDYINGSLYGSAGDPDIHWMSLHTQRVSTNSY